MPRGQFHSPEVQWIVVRLCSTMSKEEVSIYTGVPVRSIERILSYYNTHGGVRETDLRKQVEPGTRSQQLRSIDIRVSSVKYQLDLSNIVIMAVYLWYPRSISRHLS
jgi:hypothetical protein